MGLSFGTWPHGAIDRCAALATSLSGEAGILGDTEITHLKALARHELNTHDEEEITAFLHDVLATPQLHGVRRFGETFQSRLTVTSPRLRSPRGRGRLPRLRA